MSYFTKIIESNEYIGDSLPTINNNFKTLETLGCILSSTLKGVTSFGVNKITGGNGIRADLNGQTVTIIRENCPKWYVNAYNIPLHNLNATASVAGTTTLSANFLTHLQSTSNLNVVLKGMTTFVATTSSFNRGINSFRGGVKLADGRYLLPRHNSDTTIIYNYKENTVKEVGGYGTTGSAFWGSILLSNNSVFSVPYNNSKAIVFNVNATSTDETEEINWPSFVTGAFIGGTLLSNGNVLLSPYNMLSAGIYNPRTKTAINVAMAAGYSAQDVYGCCASPNGKVLFVPYNSLNFMVYKNSKVEKLTGPVAPGNEAFRGAVLLKNGEILCVPYNSSKAAIYNPDTDAVRYTSTVFPGEESYETGTLLPDGRVFLCPAKESTPAIFNPIDETLEIINFPVTVNSYYGCSLIEDNRILIFPRDSNTGAIFSVPCINGFDYSVLTSPLINKL